MAIYTQSTVVDHSIPLSGPLSRQEAGDVGIDQQTKSAERDQAMALPDTGTAAASKASSPPATPSRTEASVKPAASPVQTSATKKSKRRFGQAIPVDDLMAIHLLTLSLQQMEAVHAQVKRRSVIGFFICCIPVVGSIRRRRKQAMVDLIGVGVNELSGMRTVYQQSLQMMRDSSNGAELGGHQDILANISVALDSYQDGLQNLQSQWGFLSKNRWRVRRASYHMAAVQKDLGARRLLLEDRVDEACEQERAEVMDILQSVPSRWADVRQACLDLQALMKTLLGPRRVLLFKHQPSRKSKQLLQQIQKLCASLMDLPANGQDAADAEPYGVYRSIRMVNHCRYVSQELMSLRLNIHDKFAQKSRRDKRGAQLLSKIAGIQDRLSPLIEDWSRLIPYRLSVAKHGFQGGLYADSDLACLVSGRDFNICRVNVEHLAATTAAARP